MFAFRGRAPVHILILTLTIMSWSAPVCAQMRVPLSMPEAEQLATVAEPGEAALLARAAARHCASVWPIIHSTAAVFRPKA